MLQLPSTATSRFSKADIAAITRNASTIKVRRSNETASKIAPLAKEFIASSDRHAAAVARIYALKERLPERDQRYCASWITVPSGAVGYITKGDKLRFSSIDDVRDQLSKLSKEHDKEILALARRKDVQAELDRRWHRDCKKAIRKHTPALIALARKELKRKERVVRATGQDRLQKIVSDQCKISLELRRRIDMTKLRSPACAIALLEMARTEIRNGKQRRKKVERERHSIHLLCVDRSDELVQRALDFLKRSA